MEQKYIRVKEVAVLFNLTVRRIQQLTQDGVLETHKVKGIKGNVYNLQETVQAYIEYLRKKAAGKERPQTELELKEQKLRVEIELKESQAELHKLKTDIINGKYITVEEVKLDYQKFFVQEKKFVMAIPNRVGALLNGYVDPIMVRSIEKDISKECANMLNAFIVAAQPIERAIGENE